MLDVPVCEVVVTLWNDSWKSKATVVPEGTASMFGVKAVFLTTTLLGVVVAPVGHGSPLGRAPANSPPPTISSDPIIPVIMWPST